MNRRMTDGQADFWLVFAFVAWIIACFVPILGLPLQFVSILYLVWRCDLKGLPALMVFMFGRGNLFLYEGIAAIRLGVTLSPTTVFVFAAFFFTLKEALLNRYDRGAMTFLLFWLPAVIPALVMSLTARQDGLGGVWSRPIMTFFIPSVYYWALSLGRTYRDSVSYFATRFMLLCLGLCSLLLLKIIQVNSFVLPIAPTALFFVFWGKKALSRGWKTISALGMVAALAYLLFGRAIRLDAAGMDVGEADKYGSTFTTMAILAGTLFLAWWFRRPRGKVLVLLPLLMVGINLGFVTYVLSVQQGTQYVEAAWQKSFESLGERIKYKLWGDRATVWQMGWEEITTPPYFFRDLRQYYVVNRLGESRMKLLPHNQFITLLSREGLWLGTILCIFIIWVWVRAMRAMAQGMQDRLMSMCLLPLGLAIFFIVGITGQSVVSYELWWDAVATLVFPGLVYGSERERRQRVRMCGTPPVWHGYGPPPLPPRPMPPSLGWRGR